VRNVDMAMKLDYYSRREESLKRSFKWGLALFLITVLLLCPFGLLILYFMGMNEMLTLFWAIIMFSLEILAVIVSIISSRKFKKNKNTSIQVTKEVQKKEDRDLVKTEKDYTEFWKKWDYFDSAKRQKEMEIEKDEEEEDKNKY
jgi:cytochrome c oxidase subunit IV